jgi:solute carrier family 35, member E3
MLLARSCSCVQGWSLLLVGPIVDRLVGGRWVSAYELSVPALICLCLSCATAVLVNISQFMCLGRFSAVTFQVTGHAKTVMVLVGSWVYLQEHMGLKEVTGMGFAVVGMVAYGYFTSQRKHATVTGSGGVGKLVGLSGVGLREAGREAERMSLLVNGSGSTGLGK